MEVLKELKAPWAAMRGPKSPDLLSLVGLRAPWMVSARSIPIKTVHHLYWAGDMTRPQES